MYTIYGYTPDVQKCINCDSAKRLCTAKKKEYEFISIADSKDEDGQPVFKDEVISDILTKLGRESIIGLSVPVVLFNDEVVGGFNELRAHIAKTK